MNSERRGEQPDTIQMMIGSLEKIGSEASTMVIDALRELYYSNKYAEAAPPEGATPSRILIQRFAIFRDGVLRTPTLIIADEKELTPKLYPRLSTIDSDRDSHLTGFFSSHVRDFAEKRLEAEGLDTLGCLSLHKNIYEPRVIFQKFGYAKTLAGVYKDISNEFKQFDEITSLFVGPLLDHYAQRDPADSAVKLVMSAFASEPLDYDLFINLPWPPQNTYR